MYLGVKTENGEPPMTHKGIGGSPQTENEVP